MARPLCCIAKTSLTFLSKPACGFLPAPEPARPCPAPVPARPPFLGLLLASCSDCSVTSAPALLGEGRVSFLFPPAALQDEVPAALSPATVGIRTSLVPSLLFVPVSFCFYLSLSLALSFSFSISFSHLFSVFSYPLRLLKLIVVITLSLSLSLSLSLWLYLFLSPFPSRICSLSFPIPFCC